jgi:nitroreductase
MSQEAISNTQASVRQIKHADTTYPIHPLLAQRWSPRAFAKRFIAPEAIAPLFEAVRWSASGGNGQPWSFIIAVRSDPEEFACLLACLNESNASWAKEAALLGIGVAKVIRDDGKPASSAIYDLGLAMQNLTLQAMSMDLFVHQMAGFSADKARTAYEIPDTHQPVIAFAIGYLGDPDELDERTRERELSPRLRKPISEFVFSGKWNNVSPLVK